MTNTFRYLTLTTLTLGLAAGIAWGAKPAGNGKPGGGGSGGGDTSTVPVVADFSGHLNNDNIGTYSNSTVSGGRVELPATGNFTMDLKGTGRSLNVLFEALPDLKTEEYPTVTLPESPQVFMSINRHCLDGHLITGDMDPRGPEGSCSDFAETEGSLKAMKVGGTPLLLGVHMQFANPDNRRTSYWVKCGASGGDAPDEVSELGTDLVRATCQIDGADGCDRWDLSPATGGTLRCRVLEKSNKSLDVIGDYDLSFGLTLDRD